MLLQAALNGPLGKDVHPALPVCAQELARDGAERLDASSGRLWTCRAAR